MHVCNVLAATAILLSSSYSPSLAYSQQTWQAGGSSPITRDRGTTRARIRPIRGATPAPPITRVTTRGSFRLQPAHCFRHYLVIYRPKEGRRPSGARHCRMSVKVRCCLERIPRHGAKSVAKLVSVYRHLRPASMNPKSLQNRSLKEVPWLNPFCVSLRTS